MCPAGLNPLTICPSSPLRPSEVELNLTFRSVPGEMKLGDGNLPVNEIGDRGGGNRVIVEAVLEVCFPLAADIVRNEHPGYPG